MKEYKYKINGNIYKAVSYTHLLTDYTPLVR